jgi:hypothetical protein
MRQVMPHRNNIGLHRNKCKIFLSPALEIAGSATFLSQARSLEFGEKGKFSYV